MRNQIQIATGHVSHERLTPKRHFLKSRVFYLRIPIRSIYEDDEENTPSINSLIFGVNKPALVSVQDADHGDGSGLINWVRKKLVEHKLETEVDGEIWLTCFPRVLGYQFKPVSFWHCENKEKKVVVILAEVHNTFGERHTYVLKPNEGHKYFTPGSTIASNKVFYVSPFLSIEGHYEFRFNYDEKKQLNFNRIDYYTDQLTLKTVMSGSVTNMTTKSILAALVTYPFFSLQIILSIHFHALRLWIKKIPLTLGERKKNGP